MRLIPKILALSLTGMFVIPSVPAFASDTCVLLYSAALRNCRQVLTECTGTACETEFQECGTQADEDYQLCLKQDNPPGTCGPHEICGVTYNPRKLKILDPNLLLINVVLQPVVPKSKKS
jgi:hypothetical protein